MERDTYSFYESTESGTPVTLLEVPLELGSDARGLAATPAYLRERGLERVFSTIGRELAHRVALSVPKPKLLAGAGTMKNAAEIVSVAKRAKLATMRAMRRGDTLVSIGGDHAAAFGTIAGALERHPSLGLVYIDAHPDCTTDTTTLSGNVHGMVVSAALGEGSSELTELFGTKLSPENTLHIGLKDFDQAEIAFMREHGMQAYTMLDIAREGLSPACAAIAALAARTEVLWVSMDLDSIDEAYAPGVAMSTPGGLTRREVLSLAHYIGRAARVVGMDIVEIQPDKDVDGKTAGLAFELIARFLGSEYSWYRDYMHTYQETNVTSEPEKVALRRGRAQGT